MMNGLVLVVEDEPLILLDLEGGLEESGFKVVGVTSAAQALPAFDAAPGSFNALISDIRVGDGISGWTLHGMCGKPMR
ncbi:hypothetical protein FJ970_16125 [Mesorhizobium sp. B2-1-8]|uniref:hypothetical protein n=1 Tax=Mesorhizobium sp. B2-1-8 TaxID=2589967 RepID=UPI0015E4350B|nr:hypothetical protein [Mesorhizobium sp. B2-1-8]UCI16714.1 hypothetical protein FJ970_16125 [Mesorhizobium sp. B2-1-8]